MRKWTIPLVLGTLTLPALLIPTGAHPRRGEEMKIAGSFWLTYSKQEVIPVGDADGHILVLAEARGPNHSTGRDLYMDGAETSNREIADLVQGSGTHSGYVTFAKNSDSTVTKWSGQVQTVLSPEGKPVTTFAGTWIKVKGTGRYEGVTGGGTYKGHVISPTEYSVDWEGEIVLKTKTASR
jgi:hypothetical protein